eukprot:Cvel_20507.t1-p1 / transcript=Cvel_20507.t1 / gene=Cvel_20507 / organism=Chromera_velia_CCMP2878 / gene_product=hypothetical protein / transcript_product=hypothetical protein / location=Cvel_scaffold1845:36825-38120(+) / protein_length=432 / sequence_SO=supercontig / SO=protein_coding / is_pseudo=false
MQQQQHPQQPPQQYLRPRNAPPTLGGCQDYGYYRLHPTYECWAADNTCPKCGMRGHYARYCKNERQLPPRLSCAPNDQPSAQQPESLLQNQPQPQANMALKPVLPSGINGRSGGKARSGLSSLFEESDDDANAKSDPFLEAWFTQLLPPIPCHSQQQLRLTAEDEDTGDKEKITSGPLQQQQQEKTTPGPLQQQQFDPPEAKMTFRSHPTVTQPNQMKTQKNQSQYDDRIYTDSCTSDTILCRDRIEPKRIVWEKPIKLTMGVSDERAEGIQIGSYGVVRIGGVDEITGALGEVDMICYLTKPGERMKHLLRGKGLVFDDGLPGPLSGRNYVTVTDADGEGRRLRITQPFGDGRSNLPFFVMCPLLSPPLLAAPTIEAHAFVKKVLTRRKQKQAGVDTKYRLLTDPTELKAWHARFGHCDLSRLVATLRERQ